VDGAELVNLRTLPGDFGAGEIEGIGPNDASDEGTRAAVRAALGRHAVLCLRQPRPLEDDELRQLVSMVGPVKDPIGRARDGSSLRYGEERQTVDAGFVLTDELRAELGDLSFGGLDAQRPGLFATFHTDDSFVECPAAATVLHARELPSSPGGATCLLDMRATYQLLDAAEQDRLIGLRAVNAYDNRGAFPERASAEGPLEELVPVVHPIVRRHPLTGDPAIYIDLDRALRVEGMSDPEGRDLLRSLQELAERSAPRYEHEWRPHDVIMWDNALVQHRASSDFPVGEPRRFWRYMIEGSKPIPFEPVESPSGPEPRRT
jgi:alpha-ketoglutarate-dependent taurine dioxygenase